MFWSRARQKRSGFLFEEGSVVRLSSSEVRFSLLFAELVTTGLSTQGPLELTSSGVTHYRYEYHQPSIRFCGNINRVEAYIYERLDISQRSNGLMVDGYFGAWLFTTGVPDLLYRLEC
jgi:hypothetical protein